MKLLSLCQMALAVMPVMAASTSKLENSQLEPALTTQEIQYLKKDPVITHKVTFKVAQKSQESDNDLGVLTLGMFGTVAPKTVENFVHLSNSTFGYGYKDSIFHRIINDFMIQGGDFQRGDGTGGRSIYPFEKFDDETFELRHSKMGRLSMANSGPNTNGAQFFITNREDNSHLDGHHVVFGQLIDGFDALHKISSVKTTGSVPVEPVYIKEITITTMTYNKKAVLSLQFDPNSYSVEKSGLGFYSYFFVFLLVGTCLFYYNHWYHKRQYITDIKDSAYF